MCSESTSCQQKRNRNSWRPPKFNFHIRKAQVAREERFGYILTYVNIQCLFSVFSLLKFYFLAAFSRLTPHALVNGIILVKITMVFRWGHSIAPSHFRLYHEDARVRSYDKMGWRSAKIFRRKLGQLIGENLNCLRNSLN